MKHYSIQHPAELFVLIPHILGEDPRNNVVVTALAREAEGFAVCALARIDLETAIPHEIYQDLDEFIVDLQADLIAVNQFNGPDIPFGAPAEITTQIIQHLRGWLQQADSDIRLSLPLYTDYNRWGVLMEPEDDTPIGEGFSYQALRESPFACQLMLEDKPLLEGIWGRTALRRREASIAVEKRLRDMPDLLRAGRLWHNTIEKLREHPQALTPGTAVDFLGGRARIGKLNASLYDPKIRDRILLWAITGIDLHEAVEWDDCFSLMRNAPMTPELPQRAYQAITILNACASFSADDSPCAYAAISYVYWWIGRTQMAAAAMQIALSSDSEYRLSRLMNAILAGRIMPPWMSSEE
ncbi:DUF4192 family protein [Arcanobacterium haemolyticum]